MVEVQAVSADIELLHWIYAAFNRREFEALLAAMQANVDWPNGMEGGRVLGKRPPYATTGGVSSNCWTPRLSRRASQGKRTKGSRSMCIRWFTTRVETRRGSEG